jgi:hypothetical protein
VSVANEAEGEKRMGKGHGLGKAGRPCTNNLRKDGLNLNLAPPTKPSAPRDHIPYL